MCLQSLACIGCPWPVDVAVQLGFSGLLCMTLVVQAVPCAQRFAARGGCVARRGSDACSSAAQVTERFAFNRDTSMQRRDLRGGEQRAHLRATEAGLLASISWGEPHAGGWPLCWEPPRVGCVSQVVHRLFLKCNCMQAWVLCQTPGFVSLSSALNEQRRNIFQEL
jgi:hypothetical protein